MAKWQAFSENLENVGGYGLGEFVCGHQHRTEEAAEACAEGLARRHPLGGPNNTPPSIWVREIEA